MDDRTKYTLGKKRKQKSPDVYSAPRRYDLATMLVMTTAFALLFAGMKLMDAHIGVFLYLAGLIVVIGVAQSLLSDVFCPRKISIAVGIAYSIVGVVVIVLVFQGSRRFSGPDLLLVLTVISGPAQGYLGGALVAGTFLIADSLRGFLKGVSFLSPKQSGEGEKKQQSPWDD